MNSPENAGRFNVFTIAALGTLFRMTACRSGAAAGGALCDGATVSPFSCCHSSSWSARPCARSRALLWLAYANDLPHKEIAEIVGVASTSVRVLLSRARKRFLENLERTDP